jgi:hypothetical protein
MNHHLRLLGQFIQAHLFGQSPNIILCDTTSQQRHLYGTLYCTEESFPSPILKRNKDVMLTLLERDFIDILDYY